MKQRRMTMLMSIVLTVVMVLAGCSSTTGGNVKPTSNTSQPDAEQKETAAPEKPELKPVELSIYYPGNEQKDVAMVEEQLNKLLKDKINATIKIYATGWGDWAQKINLMVSGGEPFDLMFTAGWDNFSGNVAKGAFYELNDLIDQYAPEAKKEIGELRLAGASVNGKLYAVPTQKEMAHTFGLFLNKSLVDKYGFDVSAIKTLKDIEPMLQKIKDSEPEVVPIWGTRNMSSFLPFETVGNVKIPGGLYKDGASTKIVNQFEMPEMLDLLNLMRDWNKKGFFQDDPATQKDSTAHQKAGRVFAIQQQLTPGKNITSAQSIGHELIQVELTNPYTTNGDVNGSLTAISRTSKNPERAMMFINLLHTDPEILNTLVFGVEGTHYTNNGGILSKPAAESGYTPGNAYMFGSQFLNYLWDNEDPQKWEKYQAFNESATPSPLIGFSYNAEPVKNEEAAIINIYDQYIDSLFTGIVDPAVVIPEFVDKMKNAGLSKVLTEKQAQVDAFVNK